MGEEGRCGEKEKRVNYLGNEHGEGNGGREGWWGKISHAAHSSILRIQNTKSHFSITWWINGLVFPLKIKIQKQGDMKHLSARETDKHCLTIKGTTGSESQWDPTVNILTSVWFSVQWSSFYAQIQNVNICSAGGHPYTRHSSSAHTPTVGAIIIWSLADFVGLPTYKEWNCA